MERRFSNMRDLVRAFAGAMNLISEEVEDHHQKVAYLAASLAEAMELSDLGKKLALYGALLHDVGAVTLNAASLSLAEVEANVSAVAAAGGQLLRLMPITLPLAEVVNGSQTPWSRLVTLPKKLREPQLIAQIIHLSDIASLLLDGEGSILNRRDHVCACIEDLGELEFNPRVLAAFRELARRDALWLDLFYEPGRFLDFVDGDRALTLEETSRMTELARGIIDFRSPFTAMHSAGVAASAERLAALCGMDREECALMRMAGNLHDVGKLKIPRSILEKPGPLTDEEFNLMKEHAYFSYRLLQSAEGFRRIAAWAALHHEKLNGTGYPFRLHGEEIPLGARIMAVADVFSAITEDRPYRDGMDRAKVEAVLRGDAEKGALSKELVTLLLDHYEEVDACRNEASRLAGKRYYAARDRAGKDAAE